MPAAASMTVYTHDRINKAAGPFTAGKGLLFGLNALQSINVTRNRPRSPVQAIGFLGIVDYTTGVVTSDVTLDCILVEGCDAADDIAAGGDNFVYTYASKKIAIGSESYALTSFSAHLAAGSPSTCNYGWITAGPASYMAVQASPNRSVGTDYAVVLGDEGNGLVLTGTWSPATPAVDSTTTELVSIMFNGALTSIADNGIPAGVQSINMSTNINRDQVLDVRSSIPQAFVTTYPVDVKMDMEVHQMPGTNPPVVGQTQAPWQNLTDLLVASRLNTVKKYFIAKGLTLVSEGETVSVGRYLSYTVHFDCADLCFPITATTPS